MNETKRAVVLLVGLVTALLDRAGPMDAGIESIRRELAAITVLLTYASRSAVNYHLTARGQAIEGMGELAVKGAPKDPDAVERLALELQELKAQLTLLQPPI